LAKTLHRPEDLRYAQIVRDARTNVPWSFWLRGHGLDEAQLPKGLTFSDASLRLDAAIAAHLAWPILVVDALVDGRLTRPLPSRVKTGERHWIVRSNDGLRDRNIRDFRDWLVREFRASLSRSAEFRGDLDAVDAQVWRSTATHPEVRPLVGTTNLRAGI
jgi:DNA-binding transcriptional LysR family regulator